MYNHNLKLAFRNLWRHKTFSLINILGLTIGLAGCITIGLFSYNELSFDRFHTNHKNIYRLNKVTNEKGKQAQKDGLTPGKLAPALEKELPEVAFATRFRPWFSDMMVSRDTLSFKLKDVAYADASFLNVFDFPLLRGNKKTALSEPFSAIVTESTARKYFPFTDAMGKTLVTLNNMPVKITGIAKDIPSNSSIHFPLLISWSTLTAPSNADNFSWMNSWSAQVSHTFVQLRSNTDVQKTADKISKLMHANFPETEFQYRPYLQKLDDIHLHSSDIMYVAQFLTNSSGIVYTLLIIAGFILLIACFNFINLTTASALGRAKETGIQKALGAGRAKLAGKFFSESFLLCLLSLLLAIVIVIIVLPLFNSLANSSLDTNLLLQWNVISSLAALLLVLSITAGLYPAIFLSGFKSTDVFRNVLKAGKDTWLRKFLVTVQFTLSVLLIIATIVINNQVHYVAGKDLGFDKEQLIVLPLSNTNLENNNKEFIHSLKQYAGITSVSASNSVPGKGINGYGIIPEGYRQEDHLLTNLLETDADFASAYAIKISKGRFFSSKMPTDTTNAIVINEAMARYLGWDDPIGKQFEIYESRKGKVVGVMKDINFASLRDTVQPLSVILGNNPQYISVKLKGGSIRSSLGYIQKLWKQFDQKYPCDYFFLNEQINQFYQSDFRLLKVLSIFAVLAICIASMGLFGLSIYTARQRTKEIGIRKVLGATIANVVFLLSRDFLKLVLFASLIAFPVAWWALTNWLQNFAYRVNISWWTFIIAGTLVAFIALFTISFQAIKAAITNPVKSLRTE